jgi:competence protein ComEC
VFLAVVLSFLLGIYIQAVRPLPLTYLSWSAAIIVLAVPFFLHKIRPLAVFLICIAFVLTGMVRIAVVMIKETNAIVQDYDLYEGLVEEASPNTKTIKLLKPLRTVDMKVSFRTPATLCVGDRVRVLGQLNELTPGFKNPQLVSWKWLKRLEGVHHELKGTIVKVWPGESYIGRFRSLLAKRIDASGAKHSGIIKALTIGDTSSLDEEIKRLFMQTGTSHILAISGSNMGIVTAFFFFIARLLIRRASILRQRGDDIRYASLVTIPFAFAFMLIAGSSIPTIRAAIMIGVYMLALFFERERHLVNTIVLSALIIILIYPHSLFAPSFQLTFMSVLFLVLFGEKLHPLIRVENKVVKWLLASMLMTLAATLGSLPIVVYHFYGFNPLSVMHNLIAIPLMCVLAMPLSLIGLALPWGQYLLKGAGEILSQTIHILEYLNVGYIYPLIRPNLIEILLYFVVVLALLNLRRRVICAFFVWFLVPTSLVIGYHAYRDRFDTDLTLSFIDVGNGDAILVEGPGGFRMLVDGGGLYGANYDIGKSVITPVLLSKRILTLDYVVSTHPHGDHVNGLFYVLKNFKVKHFVTGSHFMMDEKFLGIKNLARARGIPFAEWRRGDTPKLAKDLETLVLNPEAGGSLENLNNCSLVLKLGHHGNAFLLTGDIEGDVEERLILAGLPLKANAMKVPHHGSKNSSTPAFIRAVKPDVAVLSAGNAIRGLPSEETIARYETLSVRLLRTDKDGLISLHSDGKNITVRSFR